MALGVLHRKRRVKKILFCFFPCSLQESDDFHVVFVKAAISFLFVTSIHVQFIQKVRQHSLKVNHSTVAHNRSFSITTQLQYLWELLLMERQFRCPPPPTSPYLPFSFVALILFCGLILMKSLGMNRSRFRQACNFHNTMTWITMSWWS